MSENLPDTLLVISVGACAYLAMVRLWLGFPARGPSAWLGVWSLLAVVFASARLAQLRATEPDVAVALARLYCATSPLMVAALVLFTRTMTETRVRYPRATPYSAVALALCGIATPWFVSDRVVETESLGGYTYFGVHGGPAMGVMAALIALALGFCLAMIARSRVLPRTDKLILGGTLVLYAAFGATTLASSVAWLPHAGLGEYGPLFVTISTSALLARRKAAIEANLALVFAARTKERQESEERLRRVLESAPIGLLVVDANGQLAQANAALLAMLGSTREQFESTFDVLGEENARRSGFSAMLLRALRSGEVLSDEFEFDTWWGKRLRTRSTVAPYRDGTGAIAGGLAIVEDITEQCEIGRRLQRAQRLEAVGQLAAGIAHEINNPMAYVRSNLSVLGEELAALAKELGGPRGLCDEPLRSQLRLIDEQRAESLASVQRVVAIVRDLREFSRASSGAPGATDVNVQLEHATRLASTRADGLSDVALELGDVPPVAIDASALRQVLLNLLTHAQQAAGAGGRVRASTLRDGDAVLVRVSDDGPLVLVAEREKLFAPFGPTRGACEPTLGLYVSHQIVREHEGRIDVESSPERGTTFVVRLPLAARERAGREGAATS